MQTDQSPVPAGPASGPPLVSVIMANHRGAPHLAASMTSVLAQTERRLELIFADDASDDDSLAIARPIAAGDDRVRILTSDRNQGPAANRNLAIEAARGDWLAIVDSDDLIHPDRLARLLAAAQASQADLIADDLVYFGNGEARTLLHARAPDRPFLLSAADLLASSADLRLPAYGYLKAFMRRAALGEGIERLRYDTTLRIGEDQDLMLRLVMRGARFVLLPDPLYAYRRHGGSTSHRLSVAAAAAMLAAHEALPAMPDAASRRTAQAVGRRLRKTLRYERLVAAIKARRWIEALPALADPAMLKRLAGSLQDRRRRAAAHAQAERGARPFPPVPALPDAGGIWAVAPAPAAAAIVAAVQANAADLPDDLPPWALWLAGVVRAG